MAAALGLALHCPFGSSAASFTAKLDRETVAAGESAILTLKFEGGQPKSIPTLPNIPNLQIFDQGSSQNFTIVNGQMSASISRTFVLIPTQPGEYAIPSLSAEINGQVFATPALKLVAVKGGSSGNANAPDQLAFLKLFVPKNEVFLGEVLTVELQLYIREGVANADHIFRNLEAYASSPLRAEGFAVIKTTPVQRRRMQMGNAIYDVATLATAVSPVKTGSLTIGSIDANLTLQLPVRNQRRDFYDPFGMFQQYQERRVAIAAEEEIVKVLPLPNENVPPGFNGAIGEFSLAVNAGPTNVAVGDPITVRVQITGRGPVENLSLPTQNAWSEFKAYPPTSKTDLTSPLGTEGTKVFEQVVVPQNDGITELPPISFSYFNPDERRYRTLTHAAIPLTVRPAGLSATPLITRATDAPADAVSDVVQIKQRLGTFAQLNPPLIHQPWFVAVQAVPLAAFVGAVLWRKRSESLERNPKLRRQRQVANLVRNGLAELRNAAAEKDSDLFFATVFRLLQEQIGERLDLPASAITEAVLEERLQPAGIPQPGLDELHELFQLCNMARYAPIRTTHELAALIPKVERTLRVIRGAKA